jgi:hypothetical protein
MADGPVGLSREILIRFNYPEDIDVVVNVRIR